ncbi:glycoside hydrolase family 3 C-terminal domain-containing protein [Yinghuangia aomiensis]|uniref:Glycoside hydrolase family 3 C-terminal domain-containing protein n=1 Tax=Yinghuangia aomiensis TaxID=676205 RepID=A0ABP9I0N3_9ACTN
MSRDNRIEALLGELTLAEKCVMVAGQSSWTIAGCERLGIPDVTVSDGPVGVRGRRMGPGLLVPGPSALASTWDPDLVGRIGAALGAECLDKNVDVLLGPTVNLHRSPRGGRHFESFSEDPRLSSAMAVAYIEGLQSTGVGACVKHFVANDQETNRHTVDVRVDERALREIYLPPFEAAVKAAGVRSVMAAYNYVNGAHACAQPDLVERLLKKEWGFDGVVISDWGAAKETVAPALHGLDVEMPGPGDHWGNGKLQAAVESGSVDEALVDDKVRRLLALLEWRGRLPGITDNDESPRETAEHRVIARKAAAASFVLLRNETGLLPLPRDRRVAVIGPCAAETSLLGGGSATIEPYRTTNVLAALTDRLGSEVVTSAAGVRLRRKADPVPKSWLGPDGVTVELFAGDTCSGEPVAVESRQDFDGHWGTYRPAEGAAALSVRLRAVVTPESSGRHLLMAGGFGLARVFVDGVLAAENTGDTFPAWMAVNATTVPIHLEAGRAYEFVLEHTPQMPVPLVMTRLGLEYDPHSAEELLREAEAAAAAADVAVVVIGSTDEWESEGQDRTSMNLPGNQDELVRRVLAANPATVVVLNCGAPVTMPWLQDAPSALLAWYPGQEGGEAIADVLLGDADPGGRMPTTWAHREEDTPAYLNFPGEADTVHYGEGIYVGYRWYDARKIEPLVPFGHGGSYAQFTWSAPQVSGNGTDLAVDVLVSNTSERPGSEVVQVYIAPKAAPVHRPRKELAGFAKVHLVPGETTTARVELSSRSFARWDLASHGWVVDPGEYDIIVAASATDIRAVAPHTVKEA